MDGRKISRYRIAAELGRGGMGGQGTVVARRKTIYFISNRESAFFDVWGLAFDPEQGTSIGDPFRVTRFTDPARRVLSSSASELGVSRDRIVVPILERSGSVWVLDQIDR